MLMYDSNVLYDKNVCHEVLTVKICLLISALIEKINDFQSLSPREVPYGKAMYLHNGMFYHAMDPYYPRVSKQNVVSTCDSQQHRFPRWGGTPKIK